MENLKSVLAQLLEQARSYVIVGAVCFVAGLLIGALL